MAKESSSGSGIGFCSVLAIVFIVLKLTDVIDWSWWWVLCPLWAGVVILLALLFVLLIVKAFCN